MCCPLQVIAQRLSKLGTFKKSGAPERQPAEVLIKRKKRGRNGDFSWEIVRARGHLDEVLEMRKGGTKLGESKVVMTASRQPLCGDSDSSALSCRDWGIDMTKRQCCRCMFVPAIPHDIALQPACLPAWHALMCLSCGCCSLSCPVLQRTWTCPRKPPAWC
jgi:hypothetical protein